FVGVGRDAISAAHRHQQRRVLLLAGGAEREEQQRALHGRSSLPRFPFAGCGLGWATTAPITPPITSAPTMGPTISQRLYQGRGGGGMIGCAGRPPSSSAAMPAASGSVSESVSRIGSFGVPFESSSAPPALAASTM